MDLINLLSSRHNLFGLLERIRLRVLNQDGRDYPDWQDVW